jgi:hypothetical protein
MSYLVNFVVPCKVLIDQVAQTQHLISVMKRWLAEKTGWWSSLVILMSWWTVDLVNAIKIFVNASDTAIEWGIVAAKITMYIISIYVTLSYELPYLGIQSVLKPLLHSAKIERKDLYLLFHHTRRIRFPNSSWLH